MSNLPFIPSQFLPSSYGCPTGAPMWSGWYQPFDPLLLPQQQLQQPQGGAQLQQLQAMQSQPQLQQLHTMAMAAPGLENCIVTPPSTSNGGSMHSFVPSYTNPASNQLQLITPPSAGPSVDQNEDEEEETRNTPPPTLKSILYEPTPTGRPSLDIPSTSHSDDAPPTLEQMDKKGKKRKMTSDDNHNPIKQLALSSNQCATAAPLPVPTRRGGPNRFDSVTGRLCVVGNSRTYEVTVNEIERRTSAPECLNRSHLGPLLRRGKIKGCGDDLQKLMEERGLNNMSSGNRKKIPASTLSAFLEEEAIQLATDHEDLIKNHFPFVAVARLVVSGCTRPTDVMVLINDCQRARSIVDEMSGVAKEWMEGGMDSATSPNSPIRSFILVTHGLGGMEWISFLGLFHRLLSVVEAECMTFMQRINATSSPFDRSLNQFPMGLPMPALPEDETPFREEQRTLSQGSRSFGEVPGRLTLHNRKFTIHVAEIYRRLRTPESLNLSILGSQLRKGKTKDNGNALKDELLKHGIRIEQGRRKSARVTCFTALLEEEALILARDMGDAIRRFFPVQSVASTINTRASCVIPTLLADRKSRLDATSRLAAIVSRLVSSHLVPVSDRVPTVTSANAYIFYNYTHITHGFGPDEAIHWFDAIQNIAEMAKNSLPLVD
ncbi:hypothetical protein PFISCL1PPCAC_20379 [Pristionchus fissidentatus]|uniref:Transcription factor AP-2 C-terminal domain-containing protein n=1 Tax=Pristionchus fissidentatus TaxID=1538716 RepID=A0AAV5WGL6_9BILA|nr:hypothetical protein PFISCL1PPCAC_20379 [Pristionchus fissidentatus]